MNVCDAIEYLKYSYSTVLLVVSVVVVMSTIVTGQSSAVVHVGVPPAVAVVLFWLLIAWLGVMEGGQGALVGLRPIPKERYQTSHPIAYKSCKQVEHGDFLERFIVGRQFLVVLVIFLINLVGDAANGGIDINPLHLPTILQTILVQNGVAMMISTIDVGQLPSQVNAAVSMLDFINNWAMMATTNLSLTIESSGLLHCVYLVQMGFSVLSGNELSTSASTSMTQKQQQQQGPTRSPWVFWYLKLTISLAVVSLALAVTMEALHNGQSGMWNGVSPLTSILIFFGLLSVVGLLEGLQIAAFALLNMPEDELRNHTIAYKNCSLLFGDETNNNHRRNNTNNNNQGDDTADDDSFRSFLIGRQIFVGALMFVVAKIATIEVGDDEANIFGVSDFTQAFLNTGLLGAVVLTVGSLSFRVIASSLPLVYMSNPLLYLLIRACFLLEATGICAASWPIALGIKAIFGWKSDDQYLGGTSEGMDDESQVVDTAPNERIPTGRRATFADSRLERRLSATVLQRHSTRSSLHRCSMVRLSSMESHVLESGDNANSSSSSKDNLRARMQGMRNSIVPSARLSAVLSTKDVETLMTEIGNDYGDYHHRSDSNIQPRAEEPFLDETEMVEGEYTRM